MIEIEVLGERAPAEGADKRVLGEARLRRLCALAAASAGVEEGHLAIEFVQAEQIARLNTKHRGRTGVTDVLSFPIDGAAPLAGDTRELGDVVICPEHTVDLREAVIHGVLHLVGMDHENDRGEMLALQAELLRWETLPSSSPSESGSPTWSVAPARIAGTRPIDARSPRPTIPAAEADVTRAGFVALAGRPNVGKSTLVNAVVGEHLAIVSDRAQTTRRAIRGVLTEGERQLVMVDLPGVQRPRPRDRLTARMAGRVREELQSADVALLLLSAEQGVGPGDRFIARALLAGVSPSPAASGSSGAPRAFGVADVAHAPVSSGPQRPTPITIAVNKIDRIGRAGTLETLRAAAELGLDAELFAISARTGEGVPALVEHLQSLLPPGPFMFAADTSSDQPQRLLVAELIREAAIRRTFAELPHALEVEVGEIAHAQGELVRVQAQIWVENTSQRGIAIGAGGRMIRSIGSAAREVLEAELGNRVYLDLSVRVRRDWRRDDALLDRLGL